MRNPLAIVLVSLSIPATASASDGFNVLPLNSHAYGTTYEELAQGWWVWGMQGPNNPVLDETGEYCAEGQSGHVWYLAGTFGGEVERTCTVPTGTALFFPVHNTIWAQFPEDPDYTTEELHQILWDAYLGNTCDMWASVDGVEIEDLWDYLVISDPFVFEMDDGNIWTGEAGEFYPSVADGYHVLLTPLPAGEHEVVFGAEVSCGTEDEYTIQATYYLTVE